MPPHHGQSFLITSVAETAPVSATTEPTDRSMCPAMITMTMPIARIRMYEYCRTMLVTFVGFSETWGERYPGIIKLWENACAEFVPFLAFDKEIRTLICTTNAIESLNARFRRSVKARGHFPTEQAALKHLYLVIISLDPTGRGRQRWSNRWKAALNAFDITFDGRLSAGRK